uniref:Uncharacterized protein n=1 Tax=Panagrolaimus superbus TaxID=310955 RepID=A0A914Z160_9BILA
MAAQHLGRRRHLPPLHRSAVLGLTGFTGNSRTSHHDPGLGFRGRPAGCLLYLDHRSGRFADARSVQASRAASVALPCLAGRAGHRSGQPVRTGCLAGSASPRAQVHRSKVKGLSPSWMVSSWCN